MWDYHIHTKLCGHAVGKMEEYVLHAIDIGLEEMGFSDHIPLEYLPESVPKELYGMPESKLEWYFSEVDRLRSKYEDRIKIKLGMEIDYMAWNEDNILDFIDRHNDVFDYVIGSIHMINSKGVGIWSIDENKFKQNYSILGIDNVYDQYLNELTELINTKAYDIIGHLDLVKKFGFRPSDAYKERYRKRIIAILDLISLSGMIVECSTAGLRKPVNEIYPEEWILKRIIEKDIPLVVSSDAHRPNEVGYEFKNTISYLTNLGAKKLYRISKREKITAKINI